MSTEQQLENNEQESLVNTKNEEKGEEENNNNNNDTTTIATTTTTTNDNNTNEQLWLLEKNPQPISMASKKALLAKELVLQSEQMKKALSDLFQKFDKDKNDRIDATEFQMAMQELIPGCEQEMIDHLFLMFDVDKSGAIDYNEMLESAEFLQMVLMRDLRANMKEQRESKLTKDPSINTLLHAASRLSVGQDPTKEPSLEDLQTIEEQQELIRQLKNYVKTIGKPAEEELASIKEELRQVREELQYKNVELEQTLRDMATVESNYQSTIEKLNFDKQSLESQNEKLMTRATELRQNINTEHETEKVLQKQSEERYNDLDKELKGVQKLNEELQRKNEEYEQEILRQEEAAQIAQKQKIDAENEIANLRELLNKSLQATLALESKVQSFEDEVEQYQQAEDEIQAQQDYAKTVKLKFRQFSSDISGISRDFKNDLLGMNSGSLILAERPGTSTDLGLERWGSISSPSARRMDKEEQNAEINSKIRIMKNQLMEQMELDKSIINEQWSTKLEGIKKQYETKIRDLTSQLEHRRVEEVQETRKQLLAEKEQALQEWSVKYDTLKLFFENELQKVDESYGFKIEGYHINQTDQQSKIQNLETSKHSTEHQLELLKLELNRSNQLILQQKQELAKHLNKIQSLENTPREQTQTNEEYKNSVQTINQLKTQMLTLEREYKEKEQQNATKIEMLNENLKQLEEEKQHLIKERDIKPSNIEERQSLLGKQINEDQQNKYPTLQELYCTCICFGCPLWWCLQGNSCHVCS